MDSAAKRVAAITVTGSRPYGRGGACGLPADPKAIGRTASRRRDHDILAFNASGGSTRRWEEAIKQLFGCRRPATTRCSTRWWTGGRRLPPTRCWSNWLRRLRSARQKARAARRLGFGDHLTSGLHEQSVALIPRSAVS